MKKSLFAAALAVLLGALCVFGLAACGEESGGASSLKYERSGEGYVVTGNGEVTDTELVIPQEHDGLPVIGIADQAFYGCRTLTRVQLPEGLQTIGDLAFKDCASLADVVFPSTLKSIGVSAFEDCVKLTKVELPAGMEQIEANAFSGCARLERIVLPFVGRNVQEEEYDYLGYIFGAGQANFLQQAVIANVFVPTSLKEVKVLGGNIGNSAFEGCAGIQTVRLGEDIGDIGERAFYDCFGLEDLYFEKGAGFVARQVFSGGYHTVQLKNLYIEDIAAWCAIDFTYGYATNPATCAENVYVSGELVNFLTIPDGVTSINDYVFAGFDSLISVTLPASLESIGEFAFRDCSSLRDIYFMGTQAQWEELVAASGLDLGDVTVHFLGA